MKTMTKRRHSNRSQADTENLECYYCKLKEEPNYKEVLKLRRFISDRGKIIGKGRTGTCSRHQRQLSTEIKKARYLALLPYTEQHAL